jgi:hypothetical protein
MEFERIDGVKYEVGSEPHRAAVARRDEADKAAKAELEKLQARADADAAELKKIKADIADMPKKIAEQAKARADLLAGAARVLGADVKLDGKSDAEIRLEVAKVANATLTLDGKSEAYIEALFDRAVTERADGADELAALRANVHESRSDAGDPEEKARLDMEERNRNLWKTPANGEAKA